MTKLSRKCQNFTPTQMQFLDVNQSKNTFVACFLYTGHNCAL